MMDNRKILNDRLEKVEDNLSSTIQKLETQLHMTEDRLKG